MLNIYVGEENVPKDKKVIRDVKSFFGMVKLRDCTLVRSVLKDVEQASYVDEEIFKDRFERGLYLVHLSTSAKLVIATYLFPQYVFLCDEIGDNAIDLLLQCTNGNILLNRTNIEFQSEMFEGACLNGIEYLDEDELNNAISMLGVIK